MSGFDWFLIAWWLFSLTFTVATVGKPRKPLEPAAAAISCLILLGFIAGLLFTRGAL